jgi:hypothetical protein
MSPAGRAARRHSVLGRCLALVLALLPLDGAAATIVAAAAPQHGECTDHVCSCVKKLAPKKSAPEVPPGHGGCHGDEAPSVPTSLLKGLGCSHGDEAMSPVATRPQLLPFPVQVDPGFQVSDAALSACTPPRAGFLHIDLQPPKPRA